MLSWLLDLQSTNSQTGTQSDVLNRLNLLVPFSWFQSPTVKTGVITGAANALSYSYSLLSYLKPQTRIATASDGFLDLIAQDFFGGSVARAAGQNDASFRATIQSNLFRQRGTRAAITQILTQLTGYAPIIIETQNPGDCGAYGISTSGYGVAGYYGSMSLPFQMFVVGYRPVANKIPPVAGYGISTGAYRTPSQSEYLSYSTFTGSITDSVLYSAVNSVRPAATIIWMRVATHS